MIDEKNKYKLTSSDLERVKNAMVELATSPEVEAKDRVAASREVRGFVDQIMKYRPPAEEKSDEDKSVSSGRKRLKRLKIVG